MTINTQNNIWQEEYMKKLPPAGRHILVICQQILLNDKKISATEVADITGWPESQVWEFLRLFTEDGIIEFGDFRNFLEFNL
jgi:predicted transcriptional regulator